ncbi:MAG: HDIG domain-containing metalloprotein [Acidobacteriaceae bacterium]
MTKDQALKILNEHIKNQNLIRHGIAVEAIMEALAEKFGQDKELWGLTGLLHDLDWEETKDDPSKHSEKAKEILSATDLPKEAINAIYVHNYMHGVKPETLLEKALYCVEELSGLVTAAALVQPDKKLASVSIESLLKKFKQKSFAAGVNRDLILLSKEYLGLELPEIAQIALDAMKAKASDIGL